MNREIKFRAWDSKSQRMYYQGEPDLEDIQSFFHHYNDNDKLMPFTGLYDKHGKEIYEGDLVCEGQGLLGHICITGRYGVSIKKGGASYHLINYVFDSDFARGELSNIEIIGNIHKNPELLKQNTKDMKINGKTIDEFIEMITQERTVSFWGDQYTFTPVVCPKIIGDGQQIIYFGTIDQRPFWWYVRIDSKTNVESEDFNHEDIVDLLEDYYGVCDPELSEAEFEEIKQKGRDFCEEMYPTDYYLYDRIMEAESYNKWYDEYTQYPRVEYSGGHWGFVANFKTGEFSDKYNY